MYPYKVQINIYATFMLSPTAPQDYRSITTVLNFDGNRTVVCTSTVIFDDSTVELDFGPDAEKFTVSLVELPGNGSYNLIVDPTASRADIFIEDNDGK